MRHHAARCAVFLIVLACCPAAAADPCTAPEYRQFDFWLGAWDVRSAAGGSGVNRITSIYGGCALREEYVSTSSKYAGTSLNFYDARTGRWYQSWIDNQGQPLRLSGGLEDGKMVLRSDLAVKPIQRITWTPLPDGRVRQLWESSADGKEWKVVFDGTYTRKAD